ncbi:threonine-phosphate decarboxylase CobD [Pseudocolwellia sp. HL-MZ7]|uniref:threonine-phosphate decarboxylase CobD n=1 Tax=Pseudocolwellia sp. HL-MZ7 TaxID=3400627 RepID=UPI003CEE6C38
MALIHGGQLQQIAQKYQTPAEQWLDLSTGIAPLSYPIPDIPLNIWQDLPQQNNDLLTAAKHYYQCEHLIVTNGSQAIIKALPELWQKKQNTLTLDNKDPAHCAHHVYLPQYGYKEHAQAWRNAGYSLHFYLDELPVIDDIQANSVLVIINPNNPTGLLFTNETLLTYQKVIENLNGLLVVDEAFMDVIPTNNSICSQVANSNTLVFRSFGKFFGLAGIRIGFLVANQSWCEAFNEHLGPWQVNGPAQLIALHALHDSDWHQQQKQTLNILRNELEKLLWQYLGNNIISEIKGTDLFLTLSFNEASNINAESLYTLLCQQAVYVRLTDEKDKLRFGIPTQQQLIKLAKILQACI